MASSFGRDLGPRGISWYLGGLLLVALGTAPLGAVLTTGSGVMILLLALPSLAAGAWVTIGGRWARAVGLAVAFGYSAAVGFVATTPWRGLTPPPGQGREPLDPTMVALTIAFLVAGLLIALGKPGTRTEQKQHVQRPPTR